MAFEQKKNGVAKLFAAIFILALAVGIYLFLSTEWAKSEMDALANADYSALQAGKGAQVDAPGLPISKKTEYASAVDVYQTPMGFSIVSFSPNWTGDKLSDIYNELSANKHGEEMYAISEVMIYPGESALNSGSGVAGTHVTQQKNYTVFFHLPSLVPDSLEYDINSTQSTIELYNMDEYESVSQVARTISHEYGHHFTMYYFMPNDEAAKASDYYRLRGVDGFDHDVFYDIESEYYENHMWSLYELAAEDYVQLMGSSGARQQREYLDIRDVLENYSKYKDYTAYADASVSNVYPQENVYLPLADEVDGLRDYYLSFIGEQNEMEYLEDADFNLSMTQHEQYGYTYYEITWDKTTDDPEALYTLICYSENGDIFLPVRTVRGDETPVARVGTAVKLSGITLTTLKNGITDEDRYFKLYVTWPDGRMQSSEMFYADF
jgi:hypothetical protein